MSARRVVVVGVLLLASSSTALLGVNGLLSDTAGSASQARAASDGGPCGWPWARFTDLPPPDDDGDAMVVCAWTPVGWPSFEVEMLCADGTWKRYGRGGLYETMKPCAG